MEGKRLFIPEGLSLDETVYRLLDAKAKGEKAWCEYKGHILYSDTVSVESAYKEVYDYDTKSHMEDKQAFEDKIKNRRDRIDSDDLKRIEKVKEARALAKQNGEDKITKETVINGLKYIAEHKDIDQDELVDGLINRNCFFTFKDVQKQFQGKIVFEDGFRRGVLSAGAYIIIVMRDSYGERKMVEQKFFSEDNDKSIYFYIRNVNNEPTYTKEYADSLNSTPQTKTY